MSCHHTVIKRAFRSWHSFELSPVSCSSAGQHSSGEFLLEALSTYHHSWLLLWMVGILLVDRDYWPMSASHIYRSLFEVHPGWTSTPQRTEKGVFVRVCALWFLCVKFKKKTKKPWVLYFKGETFFLTFYLLRWKRNYL